MIETRSSWTTHCLQLVSGFRKVGVLSLLALLIAVGPASAEKNIIGHIAKIRGDWQLYPDGADSSTAEKLAKGQGVPAGAAIRINTPSAQDYIVIIGLDLSVIEERRCEGKDTCHSPILLPQKNEKQGASDKFISLLNDVWVRFEHEEYQPSFHRMRGALIADGIVALRDHTLDLKDILGNEKPGRFVLTSTEAADRPNATIHATKFSWNASITTIVPAPALSPGLFDINFDNDEDASATARRPKNDAPACILVCEPSTCPDAIALFGAIRDLTASWNGSDEEDTLPAHEFLRSLLASMTKDIEAFVPPKRQ